MAELRYISLLLLAQICVLQLQFPLVHAQRTELDLRLGALYRSVRLWALLLTGRSGDDEQNIGRLYNMGKTQKSNMKMRSYLAFCDAKNGPGKRSAETPQSVHRLRPGDIDIIGGLGDSLTAANGAFANSLLQVSVENRGVAFSIGGQEDWRTYLTLPNILKEFNPNLYGYSLKDGLASERNSRFNVAELGAMSRDIPYEARVLVKRLRHDPKVNMTHDWKLITLLIGNNDLCSDICYHNNPMIAIQLHESHMLAAYRYLRDNVPRLILNVVPPPDLRFLNRMKGLPVHCQATLAFSCPCIFGKNKKWLDFYGDLIEQWLRKDYEIIARDEFNTETFTINVQPFTHFDNFVSRSDEKTDTRFLSADCFHLSQLGHAAGANALWNNMLEYPSEKSLYNAVLFQHFRCPTEKRPYLITRVNSKPNFKVA